MQPVFVYGLLRPGRAGFAELDLAGRVDILGPALVAGTLHDLGDYPGVTLGGPGLIMGELLLPRDEGVIVQLDAFELYDATDPAGSEYLRVEAVTTTGMTIWIYIYNFPLNGVPVIASGDWNRRDNGGVGNSSLL
jgi:gamma-glutamylcyclotransferase (GGCT)/AIG2-like uncharacterized protein YtfP